MNKFDINIDENNIEDNKFFEDEEVIIFSDINFIKKNKGKIKKNR